MHVLFFFFHLIRLIKTCGPNEVLKIKHLQNSLQVGGIKALIVRLRKEEKSEGHVVLSLTGVFS